jgi:Tfp pilus assembly protein PilO
MILIGLVALAAVAGLWILVVSPKRHQANDLADQVTQLQGQLTQEQQAAVSAKQARKGFAENYHQIVALGTATPADAQTPSLLVDLQNLADRAHVDFISFTLQSTGGSSDTSQIATPPPLTSGTNPTSSDSTASTSTAPASTGSTPTTDTSSTPTGSTAAVTPPVPAATETSASLLPLGATIGPAGLAVMPYQLEFEGGFFQVADFLHEVDAMVRTHNGTVGIHGRLLTVDGFDLSISDSTGGTVASAPTSTPRLDVTMNVRTYLVPPTQGVTGGATPAGPPSAIPAAATSPSPPTSTTAPTSTPTATTTP